MPGSNVVYAVTRHLLQANSAHAAASLRNAKTEAFVARESMMASWIHDLRSFLCISSTLCSFILR
jgi:hypothetical protein